jgi:hypothetical protein
MRLTQRSWPPSPHDPRERVAIGAAGQWSIRQFAPQDPKLAYFTGRGFLHLQLWHPEHRISILTPSRLTAGRFEAWAVGGDRLTVVSWDEIAAGLGDITAPTAAEIRALERWLVMRHEPAPLRLLRTWWAAPPARQVRS